jgi:hypothetical protein
MNAQTRRAIAAVVLVVSCALPLAGCDSDPPARDPGKPMTSADLTKLGCC